MRMFKQIKTYVCFFNSFKGIITRQQSFWHQLYLIKIELFSTYRAYNFIGTLKYILNQ
jgi:hypothetical protein